MVYDHYYLSYRIVSAMHYNIYDDDDGNALYGY
jgi:hypothetical protein